MPYGWLIYIGFAVAYTWLVFSVPFDDNFPPIWSNKNTTPRSKIIFIHSLFLLAFLGLLAFLAWRQSSFNWPFRGTRWNNAAFQMLFVVIFAGVVERLWLYKGPKPGTNQNGSDYSNEN